MSSYKGKESINLNMSSYKSKESINLNMSSYKGKESINLNIDWLLMFPKNKSIIYKGQHGIIIVSEKNYVGNSTGTIQKLSWFFKVKFDNGTYKEFFDPIQLYGKFL